MENADKPDALMDDSLCSSENEIVENAKKSKKKNKLRKKHQKKNQEKTENFEDGEIKSIQNDEEDNEDNLSYRNIKEMKEKSLAHEIFCNKNEEEEFKGKRKERKNCKIDPLELSEFVLSDKETEVISADIPERIFMKYQDER